MLRGLRRRRSQNFLRRSGGWYLDRLRYLLAGAWAIRHRTEAAPPSTEIDQKISLGSVSDLPNLPNVGDGIRICIGEIITVTQVSQV